MILNLPAKAGAAAEVQGDFNETCEGALKIMNSSDQRELRKIRRYLMAVWVVIVLAATPGLRAQIGQTVTWAGGNTFNSYTNPARRI